MRKILALAAFSAMSVTPALAYHLDQAGKQKFILQAHQVMDGAASGCGQRYTRPSQSYDHCMMYVVGGWINFYRSKHPGVELDN